MRVSTAYSFDSTVYELQRRQDELTHAQEQMNSGKRAVWLNSLVTLKKS